MGGMNIHNNYQLCISMRTLKAVKRDKPDQVHAGLTTNLGTDHAFEPLFDPVGCGAKKRVEHNPFLRLPNTPIFFRNKDSPL